MSGFELRPATVRADQLRRRTGTARPATPTEQAAAGDARRRQLLKRVAGELPRPAFRGPAATPALRHGPGSRPPTPEEVRIAEEATRVVTPGEVEDGFLARHPEAATPSGTVEELTVSHPLVFGGGEIGAGPVGTVAASGPLTVRARVEFRAVLEAAPGAAEVVLRLDLRAFLGAIGAFDDAGMRRLTEDALREMAAAAGQEPPALPASPPPGAAPSAYRPERRDEFGFLLFRVLTTVLVGTVAGGAAAAVVAEDLHVEMTKALVTAVVASLGAETVLGIERAERRRRGDG